MDPISTTGELARSSPLVASAFYLNFISQYGSVVVTTLAITYGVVQIILRVREHRAIMRKNKEEADASERE